MRHPSWSVTARAAAAGLVALSFVFPWYSLPADIGDGTQPVFAWDVLRGDPSVALVLVIPLVIAALSGNRLRGLWRGVVLIATPIILYYSATIALVVSSLGFFQPTPWPLRSVMPVVPVSSSLGAGCYAILAAHAVLLVLWGATVWGLLRLRRASAT